MWKRLALAILRRTWLGPMLSCLILVNSTRLSEVVLRSVVERPTVILTLLGRSGINLSAVATTN